MSKVFLITTAIPYVNAEPHLGHALEFVQADTIARYYRLLKRDVYFLSGTDENALKNVQAAEKLGIPVQKLVDQNAQKFYDLKKVLHLSFDGFIRTTERKHFNGAWKLWLLNQKDIYQKKYSGLYCLGCEAFYNQEELKNGLCPEHKTKPEKVEEENYFFKLSDYQERILKLIETDGLKIIPQIRKNEVLSFVKQGLKDFSISRSKERAHGWGVPVPNDPSQIMYVWFDALANYLTGLDFAENGELFRKYWLSSHKRIHIIGKGITRFHAVYWPSLLLSAGLPLPSEIFVHGYLTAEGEKISKSLGNIIDPFALAEKYGTDPVRYYLLKEIPAYKDGSFSYSHFEEVYQSDLANGLGNLLSRIARLAEGKKITTSHSGIETLLPFMEEFRFNDALAFIVNKIAKANKLVDQNKPWELKGKRLKKVLEDLTGKILEIATLLEPFLPETSQKIKNQFEGAKVTNAPPLFPRLK